MTQFTYENLVSGDRLLELADWQYNRLNSKERHPVPDYLTPIIIYCHTEFVNELFDRMRGRTPYVLISHNGDGKAMTNPRSPFAANTELLPDNVIHWFAQNLQIQHPRITALPIGLENRCWFPEINKQKQIANIIGCTKNHVNLCYMNFNINTNVHLRGRVHYLFHDKDWVTVDMRGNGSDFSLYLNNLCQHKFVLCPEGNPTDDPVGGGGVSTHRFWETLYVGSIPIIRKGPPAEHFKNLPVLMVDRWEDIDEQMLEEEYTNISKGQYDFRCMDLSYWRKQIRSMKCKT